MLLSQFLHEIKNVISVHLFVSSSSKTTCQLRMRKLIVILQMMIKCPVTAQTEVTQLIVPK